MKKYYRLYICALVVLIGWLIFSTKFIVTMSGLGEAREIDFSEFYPAIYEGPTYCGIDMTQIVGGELGQFGAVGWAVVETENDNSSKRISYILNGPDKSYELAMGIIERADIRRAFPEMKINGNYHGFKGDFSTLGIKNGIYNVYIYCWENADSYGMKDTLYQFEKHNDTLRWYLWRSSELKDIVEVTQTEDTVGYLDTVVIEDQYIAGEQFINVFGWEYVEEENCDTQTVYVEFTDRQGNKRQFTTKSVKRDDIAALHENELYTQSGYRTLIPVSCLLDSSYSIRILIENNGEVWGSKTYTITKNVTFTLQEHEE